VLLAELCIRPCLSVTGRCQCLHHSIDCERMCDVCGFMQCLQNRLSDLEGRRLQSDAERRRLVQEAAQAAAATGAPKAAATAGGSDGLPGTRGLPGWWQNLPGGCSRVELAQLQEDAAVKTGGYGGAEEGRWLQHVLAGGLCWAWKDRAQQMAAMLAVAFHSAVCAIHESGCLAVS